MRWHRKLKELLPSRPTTKQPRPKQRVRLHLEELETRALLSASSATPVNQPATAPANNENAHPLLTVVHPNVSPQGSPAISGYTPQQIQQAYGVDSLLNNGVNGKGETIAIVDAYYDPNILSDANTFNSQFNLPVFNSSSGGPIPIRALPSTTAAPLQITASAEVGARWAGPAQGRRSGRPSSPWPISSEQLHMNNRWIPTRCSINCTIR